MQNDSRVVKVGDVVAWADVPDGALVRSQSSYTWWYLHCGEHGCVVGIRGTKDGGTWWPWGAAGTTPKWLGWSCADHPVTVIALNLTGEETADDLRRIAEVFEVREALHAAPGLPGFWRVGLNSDVPGGEMMLGGFSGSADKALQFWAERLHAVGWCFGMTVEDAARLLAETT